MAYQPKSYRKFVATAATATLVATAFAPFASAHSFKDVEKKYDEAVDFLVSKGIKGLADGTFGTQQNIKRIDAAVMLGQALGLDKVTDAPASGFTDVPARAATIVNTFKAKGITSGKTATTFGANDLITRDELAVWIFKAFELKAKDGSTNKFTDVADNYKAAVQALVDNEITVGTTETTFGSKNNAKRGDFALFIKRAVDAVAVPAVAGVSAVNSTTLTLTGEALKKLTVEQVSLAGNKVTAVTPSADGKSATVTLENKLAPNAEYTLKTKIENVEKEYKFTFGYVISKVTINETTFDDDRAGQKVTFRINNESVNADIDDLKAAGYDVDFVAVNDKNQAAPIFTNGATPTPGTTNISKTGALTHPLVKGTYKVEIQISKGGVIVVSDSATINVVNIDAQASAIKSVVFAQYGKDKTDGGAAYGASALAGDDFKMNSTTLVAGEKAEVQKVVATIAGEDSLASYENVVVTSSNPSVISVVKGATAADGIVLTAEAKGSATITVKVGAQTQTYNFTVTNEVRELKSVTANPGAVTVVKGKTTQVQVKTTDQYGDPIKVESADVIENIADTTLVSAIDVVTDTANSVGTTTLTITAGAKAGKDTVFFQDKAVKPTKTYGSLAINVTEVDNVGSQKLEIASDSESSDATLNLLDTSDDTVKYNLKTYNSNGVFVENADLSAYTIAPVNTDIVTVTPAATDFVVTAKAKGTTDVVVTETATGKFVGKVTITVEQAPYKITAVSWKTAPTSDYHGDVINYKDVLDVEISNVDDIVKGITLSKTTQHKVRIVEGTTDTGMLYLDINANGAKDAGDIELGVLTIGATSDSNFTISSANSIAGYTTAAAPTKDKGTINFKILTDVTKPETAIASTSVKVEVK